MGAYQNSGALRLLHRLALNTGMHHLFVAITLYYAAGVPNSFQPAASTPDDRRELKHLLVHKYREWDPVPKRGDCAYFEARQFFHKRSSRQRDLCNHS